jgi:hypothetical protein
MTCLTKINFFFHKVIVLFSICCWMFIGCSVPEKSLKKDQLTITYRSQSSFGTEIKELRLNHPIKLSMEQTINHLLSLHYEELFLSGKRKYIFSSNDVLKVAPLITKALNRMKPNKILYYEIDSPKGKTVGTVFGTKGKINWKFEAINGSSFLKKAFGGLSKASSWTLLPAKGQQFNKGYSMFGNEQTKNWIVADLYLPIKSKRGTKLGVVKKTSQKKRYSQTLKQKESNRVPNSKKMEFKKRLQLLKDLYHKKLIDDEEYKLKKAELLGQFP